MKTLPVLIGLCCLQGAMCCAQTAEVRVDLSQAGKKVSPDQFGIFFEAINHAGEGRLELVRNSSFHEAPTLDAWSAVHSGTAQVNIFFETEKPLNAADYTYTARVRKTSGNGGISVRFAAQDHGGTYLAWYLGVKDRSITEMWGGLGDLKVRVYQPETSFSGPISREVNSTIEIGRWYSVAIHVTGRSVVCALDGKEIHHAPVPETLGPSVHGAADRTPTGSVVIRLVNISQLKQSASIALAGTGTNKYSTVASTLTPADLDAENSLSDPARIASVEHKLPVVGGNFQFEMEGNSFTVLKLSPEKR